MHRIHTTTRQEREKEKEREMENTQRERKGLYTQTYLVNEIKIQNELQNVATLAQGAGHTGQQNKVGVASRCLGEVGWARGKGHRATRHEHRDKQKRTKRAWRLPWSEEELRL